MLAAAVVFAMFAACGQARSPFGGGNEPAAGGGTEFERDPKHVLVPVKPAKTEAASAAIYEIKEAKAEANARLRLMTAKAVVVSKAGTEQVELAGKIRDDGSATLLDLKPLANDRQRLVGEGYCVDREACTKIILKIYFKVGAKTLRRQFISEGLSLRSGPPARPTASPTPIGNHNVSTEPPTTAPPTGPTPDQEEDDDEFTGRGQMTEYVGAPRHEEVIERLYERPEAPEAMPYPPPVPTAPLQPTRVDPPPPNDPVPEKEQAPVQPAPAPQPAPTQQAPAPAPAPPAQTQPEPAPAPAPKPAEAIPPAAPPPEIKPPDTKPVQPPTAAPVPAPAEDLTGSVPAKPQAQPQPAPAPQQPEIVPVPRPRPSEAPPREPLPQPKPQPKPVVTPKPTPVPTAQPPPPKPTATPTPKPKPKNPNAEFPIEAQVVPEAPARTQQESKMIELEKQLAPLINLRGGGRAVGAYDEGELERGNNLPKIGSGYQVAPSHMQRDRHWGAGMMISLLQNAFHMLISRWFPGTIVSVGDIAKREGGAIGNHASHQNGLDVDVPYIGTKDFVTVLRSGRVGADFDYSKNWQFFRLVASQQIMIEGERVSALGRIFVHESVKRAFCDWTKQHGLQQSALDAEILRRLRITRGSHDNHFHLRLKCSPHYPVCRQQAEPPAGTGC